VREMLDVGGLVSNVLFGALFMVCHGRFVRGQILRACCGLVRTTLHYRRKKFRSFLTKLRVLMLHILLEFSLFHYFFFMLLYMLYEFNNNKKRCALQ